ncbi:MAG: alpha/beta hydrolase [Verrucomicrobiales bacterium]|nr:alpha/beta hydrolase [Verrucomicrobiales bacterium]
MKFITSLAAIFLLGTFSGFAQKNYPPVIEGTREIVYKEIGETKLKLWMFSPDDGKAADSRPAIIFFFGGGWKGGSPGQFISQSEYLAKRGMVAFVADYRVSSRHGTKAKDCVADARDAMRYVRSHASELGVDPNRLAAGGGSAGGHIAACLGVIEDDAASKPNALALFNPACVLAPIDGKMPWLEDRSEELTERMGVDPKALSPAHHVSAKAPPCIIFHGKADDTVPYATAEVFAEKMKAAGVNCVLEGYEGERHGFFNAGRKPAEGNEPALPQTLKQLDEFLVELGWLE